MYVPVHAFYRRVVGPFEQIDQVPSDSVALVFHTSKSSMPALWPDL